MSNYYNDQWRLPNNENKDKQSNYSMSFDGSQYIDANFTGLNGLSQSTISIWAKTSNVTLGRFLYGNRDTGYNGLACSTWTDGNIYFYCSSTSSLYFNMASAGIQNNQWFNLVFVFDGLQSSNTDKVKMYVNKNLITYTTSTTFPTTLQTSSKSFKIGHDGQGNAYWNGQIDAVSIFNYALTDGTGGTVNQIAALYGSSSTGIGNPMSLSPAPVAYYPLGDQDAFNGADYLVPNSSLKDYVFDFNNSQEINCGNDSSLQMDTVFTMSCWINTTSTSRGSIMGTFISNGYYIDLMASGTVQGGYHSTGSHFLRPSSSTVNDGNWHHICYVISGTATDGSDLDVYVDGQLDNGSFTSSGTPSGAVTTNPFKINLQGYDGRYTGKTSNVQVFNSALPATGSNSIETLYNNGSPLTSMSGFTSLQGWWKLDASATYDGTDWTIPDDSSNSNDGTSSGMTQANLVQSDLSFTSGYSPYALDFDGTDQYISCSSSTIFQNNSNFSVSFWVNMDDYSGAGCFLMSQGTGSSNLFHIYAYGGNTIQVRLRKNNLGNGLISNIDLNNKWSNICLVYDGTKTGNSNRLKFYINKVEQTISFNQDIQSSINIGGDFLIGQQMMEQKKLLVD